MNAAILIISADAERADSLADALERRGVFVDVAPADAVRSAVVVAAPDLIVVYAEDAHPALVRSLTHAAPRTPVVILISDPSEEESLRAFPPGAAAAVSTAGGADAAAARLVPLAVRVEHSGGSLLPPSLEEEQPTPPRGTQKPRARQPASARAARPKESTRPPKSQRAGTGAKPRRSGPPPKPRRQTASSAPAGPSAGRASWRTAGSVSPSSRPASARAASPRAPAVMSAPRTPTRLAAGVRPATVPASTPPASLPSSRVPSAAPPPLPPRGRVSSAAPVPAQAAMPPGVSPQVAETSAGPTVARTPAAVSIGSVWPQEPAAAAHATAQAAAAAGPSGALPAAAPTAAAAAASVAAGPPGAFSWDDKSPLPRHVPQAAPVAATGLAAGQPLSASAATLGAPFARRRGGLGRAVRVLVVFLSILLLSAAILLAATVGPERVLTQLHALVRAYLEGPAPAAVPTSSASAAASGKQAASAKPGDSDSDAREGPIAESQRRVPNCTELLRDQPASKSPKRAGLTPHQQAALAEHLELRNDLTGALRAYCAGVAAFPESASLRAGEVNMLLSMGDADAALKEAREALKVFPNSARIEDLLGDALAHRGQWDEARQTWLDAAGVRSDDQEAVMHLAHQHLNPAREALNQRKFGLARQYFRRAALLDPTDAEAATGVVQMLLRLDDAKPAVVWARRLLKLQPRMSAAHVILGQALAKSGDMSGAEAAWRTALEYNPGDEEAKRRLQALRQARD